MAHGDARDGKWTGNWRMEWVASTLHTTSEHGISSITTADAHTSAASSRLNWRHGRFKLTRPFRRKTKSGFRACAITFQTQSTADLDDSVVTVLTAIPRLKRLKHRERKQPPIPPFPIGCYKTTFLFLTVNTMTNIVMFTAQLSYQCVMSTKSTCYSDICLGKLG